VFNNPAKIPQWILPPKYRTQQSSLLVPVCTLLNALLAEYILTEHPTELLLNAHLAELSESLVILVLL
jgi:hypothetical protein